MVLMMRGAPRMAASRCTHLIHTAAGFWSLPPSCHNSTPWRPPLLSSPQLLGAMAHCAPKQLGSCLPVVVPRLGEVLADPHPKVASAAKTALNEVSHR